MARSGGGSARIRYVNELDIIDNGAWTLFGFINPDSADPVRGYIYADMITDTNARMFLEMGNQGGVAQRLRLFINYASTSLQVSTTAPGMTPGSWYGWAIVKQAGSATDPANYTWYLGPLSGSMSALSTSFTAAGVGALASAATETILLNRDAADRGVSADLAYLFGYNTDLSIADLNALLGGNFTTAILNVIAAPDLTLAGNGDDLVPGGLGTAELLGSPTAVADPDFGSDDRLGVLSSSLGFSTSIIGDSSVNTRPWLPTDLGAELLAWYDATDDDTITTGTGGISEWRDKSDNARHISQSNTANRPQRVGSTVTFNGSDEYLFRTDGFVHDAGDAMAWMHVTMASGQVNDRLWAEGNSADNNAIYCLGYAPVTGDTRDIACQFRGDVEPGAQNAVFDALAWDGTPNLVMAQDTGTNFAGWLDGTQAGTNFAYSRTAATFNRFAVGGLLRVGIAVLANYTARDLVFTRNLSVDDRQRMEGYLAHKHGTQANLPVGHPYLAAPPTIATSDNRTGTLEAALGFTTSLTAEASAFDAITFDANFEGANMNTAACSVTAGAGTATPTIDIDVHRVPPGGPGAGNLINATLGRVGGVGDKTSLTFTFDTTDAVLGMNAAQPWFWRNVGETFQDWRRMDTDVVSGGGRLLTGTIAASIGSITGNEIEICLAPGFNIAELNTEMSGFMSSPNVTSPPGVTNGIIATLPSVTNPNTGYVTGALDQRALVIHDPAGPTIPGLTEPLNLLVTNRQHSIEDISTQAFWAFMNWAINSTDADAVFFRRNFRVLCISLNPQGTASMNLNLGTGSPADAEAEQNFNRTWDEVNPSAAMVNNRTVINAFVAQFGNFLFWNDIHNRSWDSPDAIFDTNGRNLVDAFRTEMAVQFGPIADVADGADPGIATNWGFATLLGFLGGGLQGNTMEQNHWQNPTVAGYQLWGIDMGRTHVALLQAGTYGRFGLVGGSLGFSTLLSGLNGSPVTAVLGARLGFNTSFAALNTSTTPATLRAALGFSTALLSTLTPPRVATLGSRLGLSTSLAATNPVPLVGSFNSVLGFRTRLLGATVNPAVDPLFPPVATVRNPMSPFAGGVSQSNYSSAEEEFEAFVAATNALTDAELINAARADATQYNSSAAAQGRLWVRNNELRRRGLQQIQLLIAP